MGLKWRLSPRGQENGDRHMWIAWRALRLFLTRCSVVRLKGSCISRGKPIFCVWSEFLIYGTDISNNDLRVWELMFTRTWYLVHRTNLTEHLPTRFCSDCYKSLAGFHPSDRDIVYLYSWMGFLLSTYVQISLCQSLVSTSDWKLPPQTWFLVISTSFCYEHVILLFLLIKTHVTVLIFFSPFFSVPRSYLHCLFLIHIFQSQM